MARQTSTAYSLSIVVNNYTSLPKAVRLMLERKYDEIETALKADITAREAQRDALTAAISTEDADQMYKAMREQLERLAKQITETFEANIRITDWNDGPQRRKFRLTGPQADQARLFIEQCAADVVELRAAAKVRALALAKFATSLVEQREELIIRTVKAAFSTEQNATLNDI